MPTTLTAAAVIGTDITFTASAAIFMQGDVGRMIAYKGARAIITSYGSSAGDTTVPLATVKATILDAFPNTNAMAPGEWFLRNAPQAGLTPDTAKPIGACCKLVADKNAFRNGDLGKYILIFGGIVKIIGVTNPKNIIGVILSPLALDDMTTPPQCLAGNWSMEVEAWSSDNGFPKTGEFYQGRLAQAATKRQPTTFWLSAPDDYDNYGVGIKADNAVEYTIASRQLNSIEWLADRGDLFIGTTGAELKATGNSQGDPLGGDVIPKIDRLSSHGAIHIQPVIVDNRLIFVDRSGAKIFSTIYDLYENVYDNTEITATADHITAYGIKLGPIAYAKRPDPRLYFVLNSGELLTLTYFKTEKVIGFTRLITDGVFEAVCTIPDPVQTYHDQVWVIVKRIVAGKTKRYIEVLEDALTNPPLIYRGDQWKMANTDSCVFYSGAPISELTVAHLDEKTVDIVGDGAYRGQQVVTNKKVVFEAPYSEVEVGLHYESVVTTMRPAIKGSVIEGMPRSWDKLWARFVDTWGGTIQSDPDSDAEKIQYPIPNLDVVQLFTGDIDTTGIGWGTDGRVTIRQNQPLPMTLLAIFGTLSVGDHD